VTDVEQIEDSGGVADTCAHGISLTLRERIAERECAAAPGGADSIRMPRRV
jgi:hypothetical protein